MDAAGQSQFELREKNGILPPQPPLSPYVIRRATATRIDESQPTLGYGYFLNAALIESGGDSSRHIRGKPEGYAVISNGVSFTVLVPESRRHGRDYKDSVPARNRSRLN
jgi:hypothetical protein